MNPLHVSETMPATLLNVLSKSARRADLLAHVAGVGRELHGGLNNAVFVVETFHQPVCLKLFAPERSAFGRHEFAVLQTLSLAGFRRAPEPFGLFESDDGSLVIVESFVEGSSLGNARLDHRQLVGLHEALSELYALAPPLDAALDVTQGSPPGFLERLAAGISTAPLEPSVHRLWEAWFASDQVDLLRRSPPDTVGRGDPNLANCLWDGNGIGFVDFEYGGWVNKVLELANHLEHVQSLSTDEASWATFVDWWQLDQTDLERFHAARVMYCFLWISTLADHADRRELVRGRIDHLVSLLDHG